MVDNDQVDEPVVEETTEDPVVELDRPTEIEGDLLENPTLEVEDGTEEADVSGDEKDTETDEESTGDSTDDTNEEGTSDAGESGETEQTPELEPEKDETGVYSPPAPDPGEFQPKGDYGFEITLADGKTLKITTPEQADAFAERLDNEENLLTARQFVQFTRNVAKMDSGVERERANYETQKEAFEVQQRQAEVRNQQVSQWNNEINYLAAKGLIPEITPELNAANWTDPQNAEQAPIKERLAIFKWMESENNDRRAAGIAEITSAVDAFRLMQADTQEQNAREEKNRETSTRQARGSMVSGNSAYIPENTQKDSIVGEGGSLRDLEREFSATQ